MSAEVPSARVKGPLQGSGRWQWSASSRPGDGGHRYRVLVRYNQAGLTYQAFALVAHALDRWIQVGWAMNFDDQHALDGLDDQPTLFSAADRERGDQFTRVPIPSPPIQAIVVLLFIGLLIACPRLALSQSPSSNHADPGGRQPALAVAPFDAAAARSHQEAWAEYLGVPIEVTNSIGMKLRLIPPGEFMMGMTLSAVEIHRRLPGRLTDCYEGEHPSHRVRITRPYYLGTHEVTVADFQRFVTATGYKTTAEKVKLIRYQDGKHQELNWRQPGFDQQSTHPVTVVSWDDAIAFSQWLSREEGRTVRFPSAPTRNRRDSCNVCLQPLSSGPFTARIDDRRYSRPDRHCPFGLAKPCLPRITDPALRVFSGTHRRRASSSVP